MDRDDLALWLSIGLIYLLMLVAIPICIWCG